MDMDEKGFVLSGVALLLLLPALLLSATFLSMTKIGGEATSAQSISGEITAIAQDIKETIWYMKDSGMSIENETLNNLAENYSKNPLIEYIEIGTAPFNIWENIHPETPNPEEAYVHRAGGKCCEVKNKGPGMWQYNFEDLPSGEPTTDDDYNEPLLTLESLENGDWKVKIENTYTAGYWTDIWWDNQLLWKNVNRVPGTNQGSMEPDEGLHVGDSKIVSGVPESALVSVEIEDPARIVHYKEIFPID